MDRIAGDHSAVWHSKAAPNSSRARRLKPDSTNKSRRSGVPNIAAPSFTKPMKATAVRELPRGDDWIYEVKWDGYRVEAIKYGENVRLLSLKEKNLTADFPRVAEAMRRLSAGVAVIDGEVVAIDSKGCPSFQALQNRATRGRKFQIVYYAFDLLYLDGVDWTKRPLCERKEKLRELLSGSDVRYNAELSGSPEAILETIKSAGLEGIIAKQLASPYRAGTRVPSWLKLKLDKAQELVIGGYKPDAGSFQSILCGYYDGRKLMFAGKVRQGFNPAVRSRLLKEMRPLLTDRNPFANLPSSRKSHFGEGITEDEMQNLCWLKPRLVAQIAFTEWTDYGLLRHATFLGLRDDKEPRAIVREF